MIAELSRNAKRQRKSECGFSQRELKKMSIAERTAFSRKRGTLVGLCGKCCLDWRPLRAAFMPDANAEKRMRSAFALEQAIEDYENAYADDDAHTMEEALATVLKKRLSLCRSCQDANTKLSPKELECKLEWERMKRDACAKHGGCPKPGCAEKGTASWICMSADHNDPTTKVRAMSDYMWWARNGGVEAMRREHEKIQWMCRCCHRLQPTSSTGRRRTDTTSSFDRRHEKQAYVNAYKLGLGKCQYAGCPRVVTAETIRSFDLDHRDPKTKATHETHPELIGKGDPGGVSSIVHKTNTSLSEIKDALDVELAKCDLLCANCHCCRKPQKRGRWDVS